MSVEPTPGVGGREPTPQLVVEPTSPLLDAPSHLVSLPEYNPGPLDGLSQQDEQPIDSHFADLINFDENATFTTDLFFNDHATQLDHFGALYACDGSGLSAGL